MKKVILLILVALFGCSKEKVIPNPKILSFEPQFGIPGETVTIKGLNFGNNSSEIIVEFSSISAVVSSISNESIEVIIPESQSGPISISIGGSSVSSVEGFKILIDINKAIDDFLVEHPFIPGIAMAVVKDGNVIHSYAAGFIDQALSKSTNTNTAFKMASISKLMVATAIMQQVDNGALDLNEDISNYVGFQVRNPNFPEVAITTRMLLKHQSSMANPAVGETVDDIFFAYEPQDVLSLHPLIEDVFTPTSSIYKSTVWLDVEPSGSLTKNSNLGMTLLGYLVEVLSGQHFNDYTTQNIFKPLGMVNTSYHYPDLDQNNISDIFRRNDGTVFLPFVLYLYPAECLHTSPLDWVKYLSAILNDGEFNGTRILSQSSVEAMMEMEIPQNNQLAYESSIGLVWREAAANPNWIGHTGAGLGTHVTEINLENDIGYVLMTNKGGIDGFIGPGGSLNTVIHQWLIELIAYR